MSVVEIWIRVEEKMSNDNSFAKAMRLSLRTSPYPVIYIGFCLLASLFVVLLCAYHHKLARIDATTNEDLKGTHTKSFAINPYKRGYWRNIWAAVFTPTPKKHWEPLAEVIGYEESE